jgi:hypothetical protein
MYNDDLTAEFPRNNTYIFSGLFNQNTSPRFVHLDEVISLMNRIYFDTKKSEAFQESVEIYQGVNHLPSTDSLNLEWESDNDRNYDLIRCGVNQADLHSSIQIAIANMPVVKDNFENSYLEKPVLTRERFAQLTGLLNSISTYRTGSGEKVDLVIFPEISIPYAWEDMLVSWSRKWDIGIVCGIEHCVRKKDDKKIAFNEILAALPYQGNNGHRLCVPIKRLKRLYSPHEKHVLAKYRIDFPPERLNEQQLIRWRGASFAIYNCFELCSIEERVTFKGKVDFVICIEYNKDVNYFSNVVESAARDLHCYFIQVNDCSYGDSRVVKPSSTEQMNPLRIKGGENTTFLTCNLDLKLLREHQLKEHFPHEGPKTFKPVPPLFAISDVEDRVNLGKEL